MRILGIDYGENRVGIAISDALQYTAQGLETIEYKGNKKVLFKRIEEILIEYEIETIVIGIPISLDGKLREREEVTNKFANQIAGRFREIKVEKVDERFTTVQAHKTMNFLNINKYKKKNLVDTISAVYILESFMNKK